jgi:hypothetical protein
VKSIDKANPWSSTNYKKTSDAGWQGVQKQIEGQKIVKYQEVQRAFTFTGGSLMDKATFGTLTHTAVKVTTADGKQYIIQGI